MAAEPSQNKLAPKEKGLRLGGARADFVASLGRKVSALKGTLEQVRSDRANVEARADLERKLGQLSSGAKMLKFHAMDRAIAEAMATLGRSAGQPLGDTDVDDLEQVLEDLPALAWGDERVREPLAARVLRTMAPTYSALIVGAPLIAEALLEPRDAGPTFGCECTVDTQAAFDRAIATEPDLIVVDADLEYASELVEALMDDVHTEASPIVVVGSFLEPGTASRYVAMGVAKTVAKPTSREDLRAACEEALEPKAQVPSFPAVLGEPTLNELGERLAAELKSALTGDAASFGKRIALGEGTEVMSALWSAIARVREVVTARSDGAVRFVTKGPEGAVAIASPLQDVDVARADRLRARARGTASEVRLQGRRVVVADDDPAVVWFMADLLKSAGCVVQEAFDGQQALELCYRTSPDLVISDIVMPNLDGFSLCRALRRDVALRDVPVVLLSWKEDLLSRVRELGVNAAGYVRKESDTRAIVARVREALRPRARVEARLREDGEIRGRLDGISVRTLLEIVCAVRPDARVSVRDASFLYELEIREGAPVRAIRADGDGSFLRGMRALSSMLGIGAGRFTVATSTSIIDGDLDGNLASQLARPIARARAANALLVGPPRTDDVWRRARTARVMLDDELLESYLRATPEGARLLARKLQGGASLRALTVEADAEGSLIEDLVSDLAARGAIHGVLAEDGTDLLEEAVRVHVALADARSAFAPRTLTPVPESIERVKPAAEETSFAELEDFASCTVDPAPFCESPMPPQPASRDSARSLEDAVMREIDSRSPAPSAVSEAPAEAPSLVEPSTLRPRASVPAIAVEPFPMAPSAEPPLAAEEPTPSHEHLLALVEKTEVEETRYGVDDEISVPLPADEDEGIPVEISVASKAEAISTHEASTKTPFTAVTEDEDVPSGLPKRRGAGTMLALVAVAGAVAAWFLFAGNGERNTKGAPASAPDAPISLSEPSVTYAPLAEGVTLPPGQGMLDVSAEGDAAVSVDGTERGRNAAALPLGAGVHDVRVDGPKGTTRRTVNVVSGQLTRVAF